MPTRHEANSKPFRRARPILIIGCASLVIGAIINILIVLVLLHQDCQVESRNEHVAQSVWERYAPAHWGNPGAMEVLNQSAVGVRKTAVSKWTHMDAPQIFSIHEIRVGWPLQSLVGAIGYAEKIDEQGGVTVQERDVFAGIESDRWRVLPGTPNLFGTMVNSLVFSVPIWLLLYGYQFLNMYQRRLGKCGKCAYDLTGLAKERCPECGWRRKDASSEDATG